jgi:2-polyprenyl-6-methoxyphenol hydroxylase-like FAD-dependent oxidoreductase
MMRNVDVVIVGGGIAGASLATSLARDGRSVIVLEATVQFEDRVRGEAMMPWGVREAQRLGVATVLEQAGAHSVPLWKRYGEGDPVARDVPVGLLIPGVAGSLNLHHPVACQALLDAAGSAGAEVVRGVAEVRVRPGSPPSVAYRCGNDRFEVTPGVVVGADGRASAVRRDSGIELHRQAETGFVAGLLLDEVDLPGDHDMLVEDELGLFLLFHQGGGRARAYHVVAPAHRHRYAGEAGTKRFLADIAVIPVPGAEAVAAGRAIGPCRSVAGTDTWIEAPFADGIVLIGDAAGHNDPTAGCGLSIAMRDARIVRELLGAGAQRAQDFVSYGVERVERMRRLRLIADLINVGSVEPGPDRRMRRARFKHALDAMEAPIFPLILAMFAGPEMLDDFSIDDRAIDVLRAA